MLNLPGESRDAIIGGARVRYVEAGQGSPVLMVHGLGGSSVTWKDNIAALAEHHRVYAVDIPGHGDSEAADISYDMDSMVEFVGGLIEALGHKRIALVGNSSGGGLCLLTALELPGVVSKLVLSASGGLGRDISMFLRLASLPRVGEFLADGPLDITRIMLRRTFYDRRFVTAELLDEVRRIRALPGRNEAALRLIRAHIGLWGVRRRVDIRAQTSPARCLHADLLGRRRPGNSGQACLPGGPLNSALRSTRLRQLWTLAAHGACGRLQQVDAGVPVSLSR